MARLSGTKHTPGVSISAAMLMVSAGAKQALHVGGCAPTPAPTTPAPTPTPIVDAAHRLSGVSAALLVLALAA